MHTISVSEQVAYRNPRPSYFLMGKDRTCKENTPAVNTAKLEAMVSYTFSCCCCNIDLILLGGVHKLQNCKRDGF